LDESDTEQNISPSNLPQLAQSCSLFFEQNTNETDSGVLNDSNPIKILDVGSAVGRLSIHMKPWYLGLI
jgi:hypothetical protein